MELYYSIVKESNADLGVNFKIVLNGPTIKAVCTKISKKEYLHIWQYLEIKLKGIIFAILNRYLS